MFGNFWSNVVILVNFWSFNPIHVQVDCSKTYNDCLSICSCWHDQYLLCNLVFCHYIGQHIPQLTWIWVNPCSHSLSDNECFYFKHFVMKSSVSWKLWLPQHCHNNIKMLHMIKITGTLLKIDKGITFYISKKPYIYCSWKRYKASINFGALNPLFWVILFLVRLSRTLVNTLLYCQL